MVEGPVVAAQRGMQVEPERLGVAEDASDDLVVNRYQPRPLSGEVPAFSDARVREAMREVSPLHRICTPARASGLRAGGLASERQTSTAYQPSA
jgi:hypothetical protein